MTSRKKPDPITTKEAWQQANYILQTSPSAAAKFQEICETQGRKFAIRWIKTIVGYEYRPSDPQGQSLSTVELKFLEMEPYMRQGLTNAEISDATGYPIGSVSHTMFTYKHIRPSHYADVKAEYDRNFKARKQAQKKELQSA